MHCLAEETSSHAQFRKSMIRTREKVADRSEYTAIRRDFDERLRAWRK
jgi:hypothetical protein